MDLFIGGGSIQEALKKALKDSDLYDEYGVVATYAAQMLYKNFTSAPVEYRTFMMEKILFPPNRAAEAMDVDPQQYVFDKTMPVSEPSSKYARSLFGHYLGTLHDSEEYVKRIYLSAMLVAEDPGITDKTPKERAGKAIHTLLGNLDNPIAGKTSQAIDSAPSIPDWLRNPESKTSTNIPPRWVIHEMFGQYAGKDVKATTKRLGKVRAGAVGITVELEKDTVAMARHGYIPAHITPKTVFKMVRRGAQEKVALNAPRVQGAIEKSVEEFPEFKPAIPIIEHAITAARIETDFRNAPQQTKIATELADGITVTVDGEEFRLHEVPIIKYNELSHEMAWANGTVFNELSPEHKAKPAQALFAAENYLALSGHEVDWDRHGAQGIVNGHDLYLFDRGGMALKPPTTADKELLGRTLASAMNDYILKGIAFDKAFGDAVAASADDNGSINYYLSTMSRGQHNLGDLRREIPVDKQIQIIMAIFGAGNVDQTIQQSAMEALSPEIMQGEHAAQAVQLFMGAQGIAIDDPNARRRANPPAPAAPESQPSATTQTLHVRKHTRDQEEFIAHQDPPVPEVTKRPNWLDRIFKRARPNDNSLNGYAAHIERLRSQDSHLPAQERMQ